MRPIDADALKEKAWDADTRCGFVQVVDVGDIDAAPTIGPIRCGECIHYNTEIGLCYYHDMPTTEGWFCADGEMLCAVGAKMERIEE